MKRVNYDDITRIINLRKKGYSIPEISLELDIPKTTVFRHVSKVEILPQYISTWTIKRGGSKKKKAAKELKAIEEARLILSELSEKEKLIFISALYWAEGSKKDFELINSNPLIIQIFVNGIIDTLKIPKEQIRLSIRIYDDLKMENSLKYWSELLGIPFIQFGRTEVLFGKKNGKLPYGMCRVRVLKGGDYLKKVIGINKVISELFAPVAQRIE